MLHGGWRNGALKTSVLGSLVLLSGCSFASNGMFPSLTGRSATAPAQQQAAAATPAAQTVATTPQLSPTSAPPALGTTNFAPPSVTQLPNTGTFVGQKVVEHRGELVTLQSTIIQRNQALQQARQKTTDDAEKYHGTLAAINTRLQIGTTPGNPVLTSQWRAAQQQLEALSADIATLNSVANDVASDSAMAAYLLEAARATYGLAGAIDEDHRQLAILEDETNRTVVLIDRLLNELSTDISRQTAYLGSERRNLQTVSVAIQNGEILGNALSNRAFVSLGTISNPATGTFAAVTPQVAPGVATSDQPLVVIRFDRANVQYQQPLYHAISAVLDRSPQANFDLVAVAAAQGTAANVALNSSRVKQNADEVVRALTDMGLPASRLRLSSTNNPDVSTNEVRIYVR